MGAQIPCCPDAKYLWKDFEIPLEAWDTAGEKEGAVPSDINEDKYKKSPACVKSTVKSRKHLKQLQLLWSAGSY